LKFSYVYIFFTKLLTFYNIWVILLNFVHIENDQFLAIFHNLAANEQGFLLKTSKILMNTPK